MIQLYNIISQAICRCTPGVGLPAHASPAMPPAGSSRGAEVELDAIAINAAVAVLAQGHHAALAGTSIVAAGLSDLPAAARLQRRCARRPWQRTRWSCRATVFRADGRVNCGALLDALRCVVE